MTRTARDTMSANKFIVRCKFDIHLQQRMPKPDKMCNSLDLQVKLIEDFQESSILIRFVCAEEKERLYVIEQYCIRTTRVCWVHKKKKISMKMSTNEISDQIINLDICEMIETFQ